mgnify:CR=1 FL=1
MNFDLKLQDVVTLLDLMKGISWGAIPVWLSLTIPVIYISFNKLLPERTKSADAVTEKKSLIQRIKNWFTLPNIDKLIIYSSLFLFILGTITLKVDQNDKEKTRNVGLRIKQYCLLKNTYQVKKKDLVDGKTRLVGLTIADINDVLELYPNEFIEVDDQSTIILCDSVFNKRIMDYSEKLLDSFLTNSPVKTYDIDSLIKYNSSFTRDVVKKLIIDSTHKYGLGIWVNTKVPYIKSNF